MNNKEDFDPAVIRQLIDLVREQCDREHDRIDSVLEKKLEEITVIIETKHKEIRNQIDTVESKINSKLDGVDEALRGNGRIGVFEQLRALEKKYRILFICVILLFGFKMWGLGLDEWLAKFFSRAEPPAVVVPHRPHPTTVPSNDRIYTNIPSTFPSTRQSR